MRLGSWPSQRGHGCYEACATRGTGARSPQSRPRRVLSPLRRLRRPSQGLPVRVR